MPIITNGQNETRNLSMLLISLGTKFVIVCHAFVLLKCLYSMKQQKAPKLE